MRPNNSSTNNNNNRKNYGNNKNNRFRNNNNKPTQAVRGYDGENEMVSPNQKRHAQNQQTKYNDLAKNARQAGDRVECEYYLQHADHYTRIINLADEQQRRRDGIAEQPHDIDDEIDDEATNIAAVTHHKAPNKPAGTPVQQVADEQRKKIARKLRAPYAPDPIKLDPQSSDFLTKEELAAVQAALQAEANFAREFATPKVSKQPIVQPEQILQPQQNPHHNASPALMSDAAIIANNPSQIAPPRKRRGRPPKAISASENSNAGQILQSVLPMALGD
jgi:Domain of unknown function (DUF4167)